MTQLGKLDRQRVWNSCSPNLNCGQLLQALEVEAAVQHDSPGKRALSLFNLPILGLFRGFFPDTTPGHGWQIFSSLKTKAEAPGVLTQYTVNPVDSLRTHLGFPCWSLPSPAILFLGAVPRHIRYLCPWNYHFLVSFFLVSL